jgi:hypothetical protein
VIVAGGGVDSVRARAGNDLVCAGVGVDVVLGQAGNDRIQGGPESDVLEGGLGDDQLRGGTGDDEAEYVDAPAAVSVDLAAGTSSGGDGHDSLAGIEDLHGSYFSDVLLGDEGDNGLSGDFGPDRRIDGRGGRDGISGGPGDDRPLVGGAGNDWIDGAGDDDRMFGGEGTDQMWGGLGNDEVYGGAGDDLLYGGDALGRGGGEETDHANGGTDVRFGDHCSSFTTTVDCEHVSG